jgi:Fic family protein
MSYTFSFTPSIVRNLQIIERVRENIRLTIMPPLLAEELRRQAHIRSTHYSTRIEGNRLTLKETGEVIQQRKTFSSRERDVHEVERYYQALQKVESWVTANKGITVAGIRKIHALLYYGKGAKATAWRDGQNVIRTTSGEIVYMPPEAADVPALMKKLLEWANSNVDTLPIPVIAGISHYQFETIHPFYDGNGRCGRMLTTWILYRGGYDLGKFYALEEFYAKDLQGYYEALITHPHHNYYFGRNDADITSWLDYFLRGMAQIFEQVAEEVAQHVANDNAPNISDTLLRQLDVRARRVVGLFLKQETIQSTDVAGILGVSTRQARNLLSQWVDAGWLEIADPSKKGRKYSLAEKYQKLL